ncbi:MAG: hypothetical protein PVG66_12050 [Chromatiales bacterium]|jgi:hypothetical protein
MTAATIHYIVPGLLEAARLDKDVVGRGRFPVLESVLSKAKKKPFEGDAAHLLFSILGLDFENGCDVPTAALSALTLLPYDQVATSSWIQLDPVWLRPDRDQLLLYRPVQPQLPQTDMQSVAELLLQNFSDVFTDILLLPNGSLLARLSADFHLQTHPTDKVVGRSVQPFLPTGDDALFWHGIMNEMQMLLHTTAFADNLFNALWPVGYGRLPGIISGQPNTELVGDDELISGLASFTGVRHRTSAEFWSSGRSRSNSLLIFDESISKAIQSQLLDVWLEQLQAVEKRLEELLQSHKQNRLQQIQLYDANGRYFLYRPAYRWHVWRRNIPLSDW